MQENAERIIGVPPNLFRHNAETLTALDRGVMYSVAL